MAKKPDRPIKDLIKEANQRLKEGRIGLAIRVNRNRLGFRGTLPAKPGNEDRGWHQQDLTPLEKIPATSNGVRRAEVVAHEIGRELALSIFDWNKYLKQKNRLAGRKIGQILQDFEKDFFAGYEERQLKKAFTTWNGSYKLYYQKLPQGNYLTLDVLINAVKKYPDNSCQRRIASTAMARLARFACLDPRPLEKLRGTYGHRSIRPRDLPSDIDIEQAYQAFSNRQYQIAFGLIATYGLRPSEIWEIDLERLQSGDPCLYIKDSKTSEPREVYPFRPEWFDVWGLNEGDIPATSTISAGQRSSMIRTWFHRTEQKSGIHIPAAYDLRHAWAVRCIHYGIPDAIAARMMGHSLAIHANTYQRWMQSRDIKKAVDSAMQNYSPFQ